MQAIEFNTIIQNGTIGIPPEYSSEWEGKTVRVIVLDVAPSSSKEPTLQAGATYPMWSPFDSHEAVHKLALMLEEAQSKSITTD
jgi:hypothetical protein